MLCKFFTIWLLIILLYLCLYNGWLKKFSCMFQLIKGHIMPQFRNISGDFQQERVRSFHSNHVKSYLIHIYMHVIKSQHPVNFPDYFHCSASYTGSSEITPPWFKPEASLNMFTYYSSSVSSYSKTKWTACI